MLINILKLPVAPHFKESSYFGPITKELKSHNIPVFTTNSSTYFKNELMHQTFHVFNECPPECGISSESCVSNEYAKEWNGQDQLTWKYSLLQWKTRIKFKFIALQ